MISGHKKILDHEKGVWGEVVSFEVDVPILPCWWLNTKTSSQTLKKWSNISTNKWMHSKYTKMSTHVEKNSPAYLP
jgi:hypothetical protein